MITKVISGDQTGADQAGLRAARADGIPTGGWAPYGWATEIGPAPWLADYGLIECAARGYPAPTRLNVLDSGATLWFGSCDSLGYFTTHNTALDYDRPFLIVEGLRPSEVVAWIEATGAGVPARVTCEAAGANTGGPRSS